MRVLAFQLAASRAAPDALEPRRSRTRRTRRQRCRRRLRTADGGWRRRRVGFFDGAGRPVGWACAVAATPAGGDAGGGWHPTASPRLGVTAAALAGVSASALDGANKAAMSEKDVCEEDVALALRRTWSIGKEEWEIGGALAPSLVGAAPRVSARVGADINRIKGGVAAYSFCLIYLVGRFGGCLRRFGDCLPWQVLDKYWAGINSHKRQGDGLSLCLVILFGRFGGFGLANIGQAGLLLLRWVSAPSEGL